MNNLIGYLFFFSTYPTWDFLPLNIYSSWEDHLSKSVRIPKLLAVNSLSYFQTWIIVLVLLSFLGLGMLLNNIWTRFRNTKKIKSAIDQKLSEIKPTEEPFRKVWDNSQDGLLLSSEGGEIITINPVLSRMSGVSIHSVQGKDLASLFKSSQLMDFYRSMVLPGLQETEDKGYTVELQIPLTSGIRHIELFANRIDSDHQGEMVILSVFRDVSAKKEYEQGLKEAKNKAEEANKLKTSFLSNMSHEIRTPLNGILGSTANMMLRNSDNPQLLSQLEIILQSGERLLSTINNILDMSKIEANKMEVILEEININDFLSKILMPLKSLAIKKGLLVTAKYETKPFIGKIDKRYFELIVSNVVGNAIKYSDNGLIQVNLLRENGHLLLRVKDKGIGISEEYLEKMFSPFEQESAGYDREFEGTGLGLTITKNLVDLLAGEIRITSLKGQGTIVSVILPLAGES